MSQFRPIHIHMKLESSDVLKFIFKLFYTKSPSLTVAFIIFFCVLMPLASLLVIQSHLMGEGDKLSGFAYFPFIAEAIMLFLLIALIVSSKKNAKQTHLIFTQEEIEIITPKIKSQVSWSNYQKVQETKKDFFMFSTTANNSFPIPKRFFESDVQIQNFKHLVRAEFGDQAELTND